MTPPAAPKYLLRQADAREFEATFSHPWNPQSQIRGTSLGRTLGLQRCGVSIAHLAPGKESFCYHAHQREEEWIYILAGRGVADIDGESHEVAAGDFMAFPTPSVAHHLRNPFNEELVYLMGGENLDVEIADFPTLGKRMLRTPDKVEVVDLDAVRPFERSD